VSRAIDREHITEDSKQRALLLTLEGARSDWEESLAEMQRLAETAGVQVVGTFTQRRERPDPVHFVGKGKAQEIRPLAGELRADVLLVDGDLSPNQQRNLEDDTHLGVLDRNALILDIFAQRARSKEGKLQVELAQLTYLLPRLTGKGNELSRLGGGIGTRGPGETKLETDRRHVRSRISRLKKQVEQVAKRRGVERKSRQEAGIPIVAVVGYTNAGKSTLLNALSGADIYVEDQLFATLDPTTRQVELDGGREILMVDTVGFIRNLPTQLINAFHATLEEAVEADLLVHVVDASHPQMETQIEAAQKVLASLGCAEKPAVLAFNKVDRVEDRELLMERMRRERLAVAISATTGEGLDQLLHLVGERLEQELVSVDLLVPWNAGDLLSEVHARGRVLSEEFRPEGIALSARVPIDVAERLKSAGAGAAPPGA
jgi:GTP-binding protein HflX